MKRKKLSCCILIKTVPTKIYNIVDEVKKIKEVKQCYMTYGRFDVVAFIEVSNYDDVRKVSTSINTLEGIRSTETLVEA
ncbi:MAG: Lrp/AsnC ligand binding domain-containing protein [Nitrososphaerales archaeon]|nr:Lrp/AsnC ligand binding domain-containing protein [Nitrososphaerales archaeon]